jgi:hypothetical protein
MIYFLMQLRTILLQQRVYQATLPFFHFVIAQSAIICAIFNPQSYGSLSRRNVVALVRANELSAAEVDEVLFRNRSQKFIYGNLTIQQQSHVTHNRGIAWQWSIAGG